MKLQDFISGTLKELMDGVKSAQKYATESGGAINPRGLIYLDGSSGMVQHKETSRIGQEIEFDIEVTASEEEKIKSGVGILVSIVGFGVQGQSGSENRSVNRIKFKIPVIFPKGEYKEDGELTK
jgi:hypothetical protein